MLENWRQEVGARNPTPNPDYDVKKRDGRFTGVPGDLKNTPKGES